MMKTRELLDILQVAERLKDTTRHCYTREGRHESVAEHSWMMCMMAFLLRDEFPEINMNKVMEMCVIHDLGEAFTGDIPTFSKTASDEKDEDYILASWLLSLDSNISNTMRNLYREMKERITPEAKLFKAIDSLEALVQHNISDISTWEELEYDLNLHYADDKVAFSAYMTELREEIRNDTVVKIRSSEKTEPDRK